MATVSWLRQIEGPLFPDVLWSRPENRRYAGKLLIIGGHQQSFTAVSEAYEASLKAGIGTARVMLPQALQSMLKTVFPEAEYAPSNKIGSFSREALATWYEAAEWADGVLLAGDFGRNSETAVLLESFIEKYEGLLGVVGDTVDYFFKRSETLKQRHNTVITTTLDKLQKLALPEATLQQKDDLARMVEKIGYFTNKLTASLITFNSGVAIVASDGRISTTPIKQLMEVTTAAYATVWLLQQPEKPFEALTTAIWCYAKPDN